MAQRNPNRTRMHSADDDEDLAAEGDDLLAVSEPAIQAPRLRRRTRTAAEAGEISDREGILALIRDIPNFLKLLARLARDARVSRLDKGIMVATLAYLVMPMDLIPDFIPFFGQLDDIYLLALALDRLLNNAGVDVLLDHWDGETASLETAIASLDKVGSYLPDRVRALLHQRVR